MEFSFILGSRCVLMEHYSMMLKATLALIFCIFGASLSEKVRYDGYQVHRLTPTTEEQVQALRDLEETNFAYDFWSDLAGVNSSVDIMVPPNLKAEFNNLIANLNLDDQLFIDDVQEKINNESPVGPQPRSLGWTSYQRLNVIYSWLDQLAASDSRVSVVVAGSSYERRQIRGVRVSFSSSNANRGVFIEGGIHAREWISPAVVTFILNQLLTTTNSTVANVLRRYDWYIFPVFNPDGYEFTHTNTRLWRKTRTPYGNCFGADPNRNWGFQWNTGGASSNPCSDTYAGPSAFSETCTRTASEYIRSIQSRLVAYLSFHSYSQLILLPYGHTSQRLDNYEELYAVGLKAASSLASRYRTRFQVGNIVSLLYVATGGSMDWVKGTFGTPITYTYELRDTGANGFVLPPSQIIPSGWETLDSVVTILSEFST